MYENYRTYLSTGIPVFDDLIDVKQHLTGLKKWLDLGLELGLFESTLKQIKLRHRENTDECLKEMLTSWLKREDDVRIKGEVNWATLVTALRSHTVNENGIADAIADKYELKSLTQYSNVDFLAPWQQLQEGAVSRHVYRFVPHYIINNSYFYALYI